MSKTTRREALSNRRKRLGLTQPDVAKAVGCSTAAVISWEVGRSVPRGKYRPALAAVLQLPLDDLNDIFELDGEPVVATHKVANWLSHYESVSQGCGRVDSVECIAIPGLLQTEEYARAAELTSGISLTDDELRSAVAHRQRRQQILFRHPDPLQLIVLLFEGLLRDPVGGREVMARQLEHLLELAQRPNIDLRIIGPGIAPCSIGPFEMLTRAGNERPFLVTTIDVFGPHYHENPKAVSDFVSIHRRLLDTALSAEQTVERIRYILETVHR